MAFEQRNPVGLPVQAPAQMNRLKIQIDLGDIRPDSVEQALLELGALSIEYRDAADEPILEPEPGTAMLWEKIRMAALFDADIDRTDVLLTIARSITPSPLPQVHFSVIETRDWVKEFQQDLHPEQFGDRLWVCPPAKPCPDEQGIAITMEPGLAFGTGSHPTTALCLDWLANQSVRDKRLLDYGCGSGILSVAGLALGAVQATAVDIDEQALAATRENARRNQSLDRLYASPPEALDAAESFDLIVANILSGTLIALEPTIRRHSRPGTKIALSGILKSQVDDVCAAYAEWIDFEPPVQRLESQASSGTEDDCRVWAILGGTAN